MRFFSAFSVCYVLCALITSAAVRTEGFLFGLGVIRSSMWRVGVFGQYATLLAAVLLVSTLANKKHWQKKTAIANAVLSVPTALVFFAAFSMIKLFMPAVLPFWADRFLADLDQLLHGGRDPWMMAHRYGVWLDPGWVSWIYVDLWVGIAVLFPTLLVMADTCRRRVEHYLKLYVATWVGLGNVLALAFLSGGPVFYDRLHGGSRFAELLESMRENRLQNSSLGNIQDELWHAYSVGPATVGTGISAFPSVHVGVAAVLVVYLTERCVWLAAPSILGLVVILFLSVYTGFHYAVDGYASMIGVLLAHRGLRCWTANRRERVTESCSP